LKSLRDDLRDRVYDTTLRNSEIRNNRLFTVGTVVQGGERHLIQTASGVITSTSFGGVTHLGKTTLVRQDAGSSFFY
jgi:hypothetical protein